jgi:hypothetical protein
MFNFSKNQNELARSFAESDKNKQVLYISNEILFLF